MDIKTNRDVQTVFRNGTGVFDDDIYYLKTLHKRVKARLEVLKKELWKTELNYLKGRGRLSDIDQPLTNFKQHEKKLLAVEVAIKRIKLTEILNSINKTMNILLKKQRTIKQTLDRGYGHKN